MPRSSLLLAALLSCAAQASAPGPVSLASSDWLGIDGNWSTIKFLVGTNSQPVNVLVSTALSEFWVVGPGGCVGDDPHCTQNRGGIFNPSQSKKWTDLGIWQLGLSWLGNGGNGDYGLTPVAKNTAASPADFTMSNVLTSAINSTNYFLGQFGLGIIEGKFDGQVADSFITQAVKDFGWISSYSYGYTAGAHYHNTPASVTLGGYDGARCGTPNPGFTLSQAFGTPAALVRGIEAIASSEKTAPSSWGSEAYILSNWGTKFTAIFDSTTPFMWLPSTVCDQFAKAFNLTYNNTLELYTVTNEQYNSMMRADAMSFTFTLSSLDNYDNFGSPLDVQGAVNITISSRAFISSVQYPFMNETIQYGQPAVPYFSLRKSTDNSTFIFGRSFLQESYLITQYDQGSFSINPAVFTTNQNIIAIDRPSNSPYPPPATMSQGLTTAAKIGIAVGVVVGTLIVITGLLLWLRKRRIEKQKQDALAMAENKDSTSSLSTHSTKPPSPLSRILTIVARRKRSQKTSADGSRGVNEQPSEAPDGEIYELPAPMPPVELDGNDDADSLVDGTDVGGDTEQNQRAYEIAKRKMERALQGPVPAYTPPADGSTVPPEKAAYEIQPPPAPRHVEQPSPISLSAHSPSAGDSNSNSLPYSLPSPMTPHGDEGSRGSDVPSSMNSSGPRAPNFPLVRSHSGPSSNGTHSSGIPASEHRALTHSSSRSSVLGRPSSRGSGHGEGMRFQRTPIDPSNVVCLGPLPENVRVSHHNGVPELRGTNGELLTANGNGTFVPTHRSQESLGSNYTEEEEHLVQEMMKFAKEDLAQRRARLQPGEQLPSGNSTMESQAPGSSHSHGAESNGASNGSSSSQERIDPMAELIHVPQPAEKRYSWEEER